MALIPSGEFFTEAFLAYNDASGTRQTIIFDAVLDEQWENPATITEHPVENGANIADHVRVALVKCTLKIRVTNQPLDSNQFADPIGGAGETTALPLSVPTPNQPGFDGVVSVPTWQSGLGLSTAIVGLASFAAGVAGQAATDIAQDLTGQGSATPTGNRVAAGLNPRLEPAETGNEVLTYPDPAKVPGGGLAGTVIRLIDRGVGTLATGAVLEGLTSLIPPGQEVDVPTATDAGMPATFGQPDSIAAQTVQFATPTDFAEQMMALLVGLKSAAQSFTVYGSKQVLASMVIETLTSHRGAPEDTGTGADITIGLKQIRVVSTNTVDAPLDPIPDIPRGKPPVNAGAQDPKTANPADTKSLLRKIVPVVGNAVVNLFGSGGA